MLKNKSTMSETQQMGFFRVWSIINTGAKNIICKVFCMLYHWVKISPILNLFTNVKSLGAKYQQNEGSGTDDERV